MEPIAKELNGKYKIECLFYGSKSANENSSISYAIDQVRLRNEQGEEVRYMPPDEASVVDSHAYFTKVWSPDGEWLVLPRGRFQGFCMIKAAGAFNSFKAGECDDFIRIRGRDETALWHEFQGWKNPHAIAFKAGLSGDLFDFEYEIGNKELKALGPSAPFQGENKTGKVEAKPN
jgi:hypothetical protein